MNIGVIVVQQIMSTFFGVKPHQNDQNEIFSIQYININGSHLMLLLGGVPVLKFYSSSRFSGNSQRQHTIRETTIQNTRSKIHIQFNRHQCALKTTNATNYHSHTNETSLEKRWCMSQRAREQSIHIEREKWQLVIIIIILTLLKYNRQI